MIERVRRSSESSLSNKSRVRGRPFEHGNPGRPPGSKNKTTKLLEQLIDGKAQELTQKMLQIALDGNPRCLQYFIDRLIPPRRGRALEQQLPPINGVHDIAPAMAAITNQLNDGELTPEEASDLIGLLERYGRVIEINEHAMRVEKVEAQMKQMKTFER